MASCPAHDDRVPSLKVSDGEKCALVYCFAGCEQEVVLDALKARGLWASRGDSSIPWAPPERRDDDRETRTVQALKIWRKTVSGAGTPLEGYMRGRGIIISVPSSLKYCGSTLYERSGIILPAMIAAVQGIDRRITAIHRTYLRTGGHGKAGVNLPKRR